MMSSLRVKDNLLASLTDQYRTRGYEVDVGDADEPTTPRADLLARKDGEERWVEVVGVHSAAYPARAEAMHRWVAEQPHRHIDMVIGGFEPMVTVPSRSVLLARAEKVGELLERPSPEAACLTAWALFEAVARRALLRYGVVAPRADIVTGLGHWGVLNPDEIGRLRALKRVRDAVGHGSDEAIDLREVAWLVDIAERLFREGDAGGTEADAA